MYSNIQSIGNYAFTSATKLTLINYDGYEEQWNAIIKGTDWNKNVHADFKVVFKVEPTNTLMSGNEFSAIIPNNATSVEFVAMPQTYGLSDRTVPADAIDVSAAEDGTILAWYDGDTMYVQAIDGGMIYANPNSSYLFSYTDLIYINTEYFDMSTVCVGNAMFRGCLFLSNTINDFNLVNLRQATYGFHSCSWLTEFVIPEGTVEISYAQFMNCGIQSIVIPTSVTTINSSFPNIKNLTIYYCGTEEQWNSISIIDTNLDNYTIVFNYIP